MKVNKDVRLGLEVACHRYLVIIMLIYLARYLIKGRRSLIGNEGGL